MRWHFVGQPGKCRVEFADATTNDCTDSRARSILELCRVHSRCELEDDNLTILDLENIILTGKILERQRDAKTRAGKSIIRGRTVGSLEAETVVKVGATGTLFVVTVYLV